MELLGPVQTHLRAGRPVTSCCFGCGLTCRNIVEPSLASAAPSSPELRGRALRRRRGRASSLHQSIDETHVRQAARAKDQSNEVGSGSTKSPDATASLRISAVSQQLLEEVASREVCEPWLRAKLMLVGEGRAGKTSTKRTLLGLQFNPNEPSTVGADTTSVCQVRSHIVPVAQQRWRFMPLNLVCLPGFDCVD